jgi:hypothetical protein
MIEERKKPGLGAWMAVAVASVVLPPIVYLLSYGPRVAFSASRIPGKFTVVTVGDPADINIGGFYRWVGPIMRHSPALIVNAYHEYLVWWANEGFRRR